MQGTNAHMLLGRAGGSGHDSRAAVVAAALPWQRTRFWPSPVAHPLLTSCLLAPSDAASKLQLHAELTTASTACWRAFRLGGSPTLPATTLLELAAGAGQLLCKDASSGQAAVLSATMVPQLQLTADQPLLLSCAVDKHSGTAGVSWAQPGSSQLLSCSYGFPLMVPLAGAASQPAPSSRALLHPPQRPCAAVLPATASFVGPEGTPSSSRLPAALCEAATALATAAGLAGGQAAVRSCAAFLPRGPRGHQSLAAGPQQLVLVGSRGGSSAEPGLRASWGTSGICTAELCGVELRDSSLHQHQLRSSAYAVEWQRMPAEQADTR